MASFQLSKLVNRKVIKISGPDCYPYLQGLLCNDLRYLYEPQRIPKRRHANVSSNVLSTFMLNAQGRAICDILLYRTPHTRYECKFSPPGEAKEPDELLIECDSDFASGLANTLYGYRVRRKVSLEIQPNLDVWCLYPKFHSPDSNQMDDGQLQALNSINISKFEVLEDNLTIVGDPRLDLMGVRILSDSSYDFIKIRQELQSRVNITNIEEAQVKKYILHRYRLGVGEGPQDHPEGNCLPLECNAHLLGSVSFDKGCYLGQELTARIYYTGVVRKRLMPIVLKIDKFAPRPPVPFAPGSDIVDVKSGKKLGIVRNIFKGHGLGLIKHESINDTVKLVHEATKVPIITWKPYWWNLNDDDQ